MKIRTFQIDEQTWETFKAIAKDNGLTASQALRFAVNRYIADPEGFGDVDSKINNVRDDFKRDLDFLRETMKRETEEVFLQKVFNNPTLKQLRLQAAREGLKIG